MDYNSIPEHLRQEIEKHLEQSKLDEWGKAQARYQINHIYWFAASNPHPLRLRWISLMLKLGIFYQRIGRFFGW